MIQFVIRSLLFGLFIIGNIDFSYGQEEGLASIITTGFMAEKQRADMFTTMMILLRRIVHYLSALLSV